MTLHTLPHTCPQCRHGSMRGEVTLNDMMKVQCPRCNYGWLKSASDVVWGRRGNRATETVIFHFDRGSVASLTIMNVEPSREYKEFRILQIDALVDSY